MAKDKKNEGLEDKVEVSADLGFGGILKGIQDLITNASKMAEESDGSMKTGEFTIPGLGDKGKGIFGFSIKTMDQGQDRVKVEPFGNIRKTQEGPVVDEIREPIVDVFDEDDHIRVLAEMPGVDETDIKHEVKGDVLVLSAEEGRKYQKEVLLPASVKEEDAIVTYKNGILELRFAKA